LYSKIDLDGNGALEQKEVVKALQEMGESNSYDEIRATLREIDLSSTGNVEIEEFVEVTFFKYKIWLHSNFLLY